MMDDRPAGIRAYDDELGRYETPSGLDEYIDARVTFPFQYGYHWSEFRGDLNHAQPGRYTLRRPGGWYLLEGDIMDRPPDAGPAKSIGRLRRTFGGDKAHFGGLAVDLGQQQGGVARRLQGATFRNFRRMGIKTVTVDAGDDRGGYAWARLGAIPRPYEWAGVGETVERRAKLLHEQGRIGRDRLDEVLAIARQKDPKGIWDIADMADDIDGRSLGNRLLSGTTWSGQYDLTDPDVLARIDDYTGN